MMSILNRKHWIFDLDGTLTVPVHDFEIIRNLINAPRTESDLLSFLHSLPEAQRQDAQQRLHGIEVELAAISQPSLGAREFIQFLHQRGAKLGILTRNTRKNAWLSLEVMQMEHFFPYDWIIGREETLPKPAPEGIYHLSNLWNTTPQQTVMVGDYVFDLETGRAAGAATIHVDSSASFDWQHLMDIGVSSLAELHEMAVNSIEA